MHPLSVHSKLGVIISRHIVIVCTLFSFHGEYGRNATIVYLNALLKSDRKPTTLMNWMKQWVGNKPWYGKYNATSGARLRSRAAFVWASGLVEISGEGIPDRTSAWATIRPEQREAAAAAMDPWLHCISINALIRPALPTGTQYEFMWFWDRLR